MGARTPADGGTFLATISSGAYRVRRARMGYGACARDLDTKVAKSPPGGLRGRKRVEVLTLPSIRSTRNVRQSFRTVSHATRYQRHPVCTSRCGSTVRALGEPLRSL